VNTDSSPHPQPLSKLARGELQSGVVTVGTQIPTELLRNARKLRKNQTDAEHLLWEAIRNRKLNKWKFRRQHPISEGYILDFYCAETKVAVELDGSHRQLADQEKYDINRTKYLAEYGIRVIRILNEEVLNSTENVLSKIVSFTNEPPLSILERGRPARRSLGVGGGEEKLPLISRIFIYRLSHRVLKITFGILIESLTPTPSARVQDIRS
jgi:very-short-patch-repair endonuclease